MAEAKTIIGRVKTRKDSYLNWRTNDPYLLEGEVAIVTNNSMNTLNGMSMLVFGDGTKSFTELVAGEKTDEYHPTARSNNNVVFYSGIGAGYTLPTATRERIGGIKLNTNYFELDNNDRLQPILYKIGGTEDFPTIEFDRRYKGVFNELEWVKSYDSIGFTIILNDVHGDSEKVLEPMGSDNPYAGTVVQYYKKSGNNKLNSFIGINQDGVPLVSKNYLLVDDGTGHNDAFMKQIATLDLSANSGVVWYEGLDNFSTAPVYPMNLKLFVDGHLQQEIEYNPFSPENSPIYVNTVENYCTNITVNGITYDLNDNHNINLGQSIWTDTERDRLNWTFNKANSLQDDLNEVVETIPNRIIFNGQNYPMNADQSFIIDSVVPLSSNEGSIVVTSEGYGYNLEHYTPEMEIAEIRNEINISKNNTEIIGIETLTFDEKGHIAVLKLNQYNLSNLITDVEDLKTENNNLKAQINSLIARIEALESK